MNRIIKRVLPIAFFQSYKNIKTLKQKRSTKKKIKNYLKTNEIKKLHIGAGGNIIPGWFNTDLEPLDDKIFYLDG